MSMLPVMNEIKCGEGRTKQKVGVEHDINKIVAKFKKTGQMPSLRFDGTNLSDGEKIIDLTEVGDFQECQNKIANAKELFDAYPSAIRRRFNNDITEFVAFMGDLKNGSPKLLEALSLGLVEQVKPDKTEDKPVQKPAETTVNKDDKKEGDK